MVQHFSPSANKVYQLSGTQKFELPKSEARIADVFQVVETAKSKFTVFAWGLADTNLEDVFIKVSREARQSNTLTWLLDMFNDSCNLLWYQSYFQNITIPYGFIVVIVLVIKHFFLFLFALFESRVNSVVYFLTCICILHISAQKKTIEFVRTNQWIIDTCIF